MKRVTAQDVADAAGVSQSAVSRVFSGASASQATVAKVRAAADALGYRPNVLARSLITGRSRIIGLIVSYLDNQFYPDALERLSNALQAEGYHVLIFMAEGRGEAAERVIGELLDYQVDGIIAASVGMSDGIAARCEAAGIPVVLFNRGQADPRLSQVTSVIRAGARKIADFLVAGAHARIAHIGGWEGSSTGRDRAEGFREGLAAHGVPLAGYREGRYRREDAGRAARALVEEGADAIFVGNDHMAFAVLDTLRFEMGLRVPEDVSVVGYDDVALASWPAYALTTLRQPLGAMVENTVATLLGRIRAPEMAAAKIALPGPLVIRRSARVPEGWVAEDGGPGADAAPAERDRAED